MTSVHRTRKFSPIAYSIAQVTWTLMARIAKGGCNGVPASLKDTAPQFDARPQTAGGVDGGLDGGVLDE
jgi:hypothetical protein